MLAAMAIIRLHEFVESVTRFVSGDIATEQITKLLTEGRLNDEELAPFLHFQDARYTRSLIHRNDNVEILALSWSRGSTTPIHDHDGQYCWMVAHIGTFVIDDYRQISGQRLAGEATLEHLATTPNVTLGMPDFRYGDQNDIHRVAIAPEHDRAVSIHVYAKPFVSCRIFDEVNKRAAVMPLRYDFTPSTF